MLVLSSSLVKIATYIELIKISRKIIDKYFLNVVFFKGYLIKMYKKLNCKKYSVHYFFKCCAK